MFLVTGTKRSGTSMWMQILRAAGIPTIGDAFPSNWGDRIRDANPQGFWESSLREGVYFRTNPNPQTGHFLFPQAAAGHAIKVFPFGVVRTEYSYIEAIVGTVRDWRSYDRSVTALRALEARGRPPDAPEPPPPPPPWAEWWTENYELLRDIVVRRHRAVLQTYDAVLDDPARAIDVALTLLGTGDRDAAVAAVRVPERAPDSGPSAEAPPELVPVFDEYFDLIHRRAALSNSFLEVLNDTHLAVLEILGVRQMAP